MCRGCRGEGRFRLGPLRNLWPVIRPMSRQPLDKDHKVSVPDLVAVPRAALREGARVWVMDRESRLAVRPVERVFSDSTRVFVRNGFEPGDRIITSTLQVSVPGLPLTATLSGSSEGSDRRGASDEG